MQIDKSLTLKQNVKDMEYSFKDIFRKNVEKVLYGKIKKIERHMKKYSRIITFNITDNDTRDSFTDMLCGEKLEKLRDQSTFAQSVYNRRNIFISIENWKKHGKTNKHTNVVFNEGNFIDIYSVENGCIIPHKTIYQNNKWLKN